MSAAHTPGPWHTLEVGEFQTKLAVCDADNVSLLTVVDEEGVKFGAVYNEADADLIAAAPELLAALQAFRREGFNGWHSKYSEAIAMAEAAIAKAVGGVA